MTAQLFPFSSLLHAGVFGALLCHAVWPLFTALVGVGEAFELSERQAELLTALVSHTSVSQHHTVTTVLQPQSHMATFSQSRVCLLLLDLVTAPLQHDSAEQRTFVSHTLHAKAAVRLAVAA